MPVSRGCCALAERSGCAVSVRVAGGDGDAAPAEPCSCSGVLLSLAPALVLCHGGVFAAVLRCTDAPWARAEPLGPGALRPGVRVRVLVAPRGRPRRVPARLLVLVPCGAFAAALAALAGGPWRAGDGAEPGALAWFALLRAPALDDGTAGDSWTPWGAAAALRKGQALVACGSAFGALRPALFLNALSAGVLSNAAGPLLLTDARCLPGTQGAGVFADGARPRLVAAVVAPLCGDDGHSLGLTLLCALDAILEAAADEPAAAAAPSPTALVECGATWGSGVLLAPRLLLTCRHVLRPGGTVTVRVGDGRATAALAGRPIFIADEESPFDVAVVELERSVPGFVPPRLASSFCPGEDVYVESYGLLGGACGPSVTAGVLSAVLAVAGRPVMLQTTCAVHSGSSGGPVFSTRTGELLGIVASNTKDTSAGATYPHLNFGVPITVLRAAVGRYARMGDVAALAALNVPGAGVRELWRLQQPPPEVPLSKL
ncbi:peroxisomal leader peptide-processing protease [Eudromia elegans]